MMSSFTIEHIFIFFTKKVSDSSTPKIKSLSPTSGPPGTKIFIQGDFKVIRTIFLLLRFLNFRNIL